MKMTKKIFISGLAVFSLFAFANFAEAAVLSVTVDKSATSVGSEINANIKLDAQGVGINAVQATLQFPKDIIQIVKYDKTNSILNFWLQEPAFSNEKGVISFVGGTSTGFIGASLQILKVTFKVVGSGKGAIAFSDGAVTASDGSGTNVLSKLLGIDITSVPVGQTVTELPVPPPVQIIRPAIPATVEPVKSVVSVPLYPDPSKWYNISSTFTASWSLPADVIGVATDINKDPTFNPEKSEGLFDNKTFTALEDGIRYLHVRFRNSLGWGKTTHWRIAVDTVPPAPFKISVNEGLTTGNPTPTLNFQSADALSGIDSYEIRIDGGDLLKSSSPKYTLPLQTPGKHLIVVAAVDRAGNKTENRIEIEIIPIEIPVISFITSKVIGNDVLRMNGNARAGYKIEILIENSKKFLITQSETVTDDNGLWSYKLDRPLEPGSYFVSITAKDSKGALSFPTEPVKVTFADKPVISLFGLDITFRGLTIILVIAGILAALYFYRKTLLHLAKSERESVIINRDIKNAFNMVKEDLNKISDIVKKDTPASSRALEFNVINKKIGDTLDRIEKYSSSDIEKLK